MISKTYSLWVSGDSGFKDVLQSSSPEKCKEAATALHRKDVYGKNHYQIRHQNVIIFESAKNHSWRLRWKRVYKSLQRVA